jgi:hypothetical protein
MGEFGQGWCTVIITEFLKESREKFGYFSIDRWGYMGIVMGI